MRIGYNPVMDFRRYNVAVVIPAYRVERDIPAVLRGIPKYIRHVIVVDDASPDSTPDLVTASAKKDRRIVLIRHRQNEGVGAAMISGFRKALELGSQIVVKLDGDGQMDPAYIPALITPLIEGRADYTKGNRFRDMQALRRMPLIRRIGNMGLSFMSKAATGYWNLFDPTNGFFAIRAEILAQLPFDRLSKRFFFETSMLANLYLLDAFVLDVPIPARYGAEVSNLSIRRVLIEFPLKLLGTLLRRILLKYYFYDFSMASVYMLTGFPLLAFGLIFGATRWIHYNRLNLPAPTGTVILPTLSLILGIQILLSAIEIDLRSAPKQPLSAPLR